MKIRVHRNWPGILLLACVALGASSMARASGIEVKSVTLKSSSGEVTVRLQDKEPVANACAYFLRRFEYVAALNSVIVEMAPPPRCFTDIYGKRQGYFRWALPDFIRSGSKIGLIVNGEPSGTLHFSGSGVEFEGPPLPGPNG